MRIVFRASGVAALAALALSITPASTTADTFKLKIGAGHPPAAAWIATIRDPFMPKVKERVAKETGHTIEWTEGFGGSLCKLNECLEAVESGVLDLGSPATPFSPAKLMAYNFAYFVPFGPADPRVAYKAAQEAYDKTPRMKEYLEQRYNQKLLGITTIGNYGLATNFKWKTVDDLKGRKIAAAGPNMPWLQGTGMVAVQSNLNEAYTSMQTGVYEGWVMYQEGITSFKLQEILKQYVDMDFGALHAGLLTVNRDTWKTLPANVQKIMEEEGRAWSQTTADVAWQRQVASKKILDAALETSQATMEMKQTWAKALPNIPKQRFEEINKVGQPGDVVYAYVKALKAAGHVFPRDWEAER